MVVSKRAWNAHNKKRKAAAQMTPEGAPEPKGLQPASTKNPAWVNAGPKSTFVPKVNISPATPWLTSAGVPLKKSSKKKR